MTIIQPIFSTEDYHVWEAHGHLNLLENGLLFKTIFFFLRQWILCWNNIINLTERNDLYFVNVICTHNHCRFPPIPFNSHVYAEVLCSQETPIPCFSRHQSHFFPQGCPQIYQILQLFHIFSCFSLKRVTLFIGKAACELSSAQEIWLSLVLTWIVLMDKKAEACNRWCTAILAI